MLVWKKNEKLRVCIDFKILNFTALKDEYSMSMDNMLIDVAFDNELLSFIYSHSCYNHIFIIKEDVPNKIQMSWFKAFWIQKS